MKWKNYGNEENTWEPQRHLDHAPELIHEFYRNYPTAIRGIVQILETTGKSFKVGMKELQKVIEMKTNLRKGYCQDPSFTRLTSTRSGGNNDWKTQEFHWNNGKDTLFPSGEEAQEFCQK